MIAASLFCNNSSRVVGGVTYTGVQNYAGNPQAITTPGQYCAIVAAFPNVIDSGAYFIVAGAGVTAVTIGIQLLEAFEVSAPLVQTWITATTPASSTGAAFTLISGTAPGVFNGTFNVSNFMPAHGIRLNVTTLTGGNITYAEVLGTLR